MKIKSSIKTLEVENLKGRKTVYAFETGDPEILEAWLTKAEEIKSMADNIEGNEMKSLYAMEKDFITMVLGSKAWDKLKKYCNNSVFSLFPIFAELTKLIADSLEENSKLMGATRK